MKKTIIDLFESSVAKYGEKTFLLEKTTGEFEPTSYNQTRDAALAIGAGLTATGIERGDRVSILSEGCNAWIMSAPYLPLRLYLFCFLWFSMEPFVFPTS